MGLKKFFVSSFLMRFFAQNTPLMSGVAKKLVPAHTPYDAVEIARRLRDMGYHVCLHHLGKGSRSVSDIQDNVETVIETLEILDEEALEMCVSLMPSEMGFLRSSKGGEGHCKQVSQNFLRRLSARTIEDRHTRSEEHIDTNRDLLSLHASERVPMQRLMALYGNLTRAQVPVCVTVPAGLARSEEDVKKVIAQGGKARLSLTPTQVTDSRDFGDQPDEVPDNYVKLARLLLSEDALIQQVYPVFVLEDAELADRVKQLADLQGWSPLNFEFEIPFGVNNALKRALKEEGYTVRIMVPYGKEWWPYYLKRSKV